MGFGRPLESFDARRSSYLLGEFGPPLGVLMEAAGTPVEEWQCVGEVAAARHATSIVAGDIDAGSVAAQRTTITGSRGGADVVRFTASWYCTTDLDPAWDLLPTGWRVRVRGDAPLDVRARVPDRPRGPRVIHPCVHRQPPGERDPVRVRRGTRDPLDRGPSADRSSHRRGHVDDDLADRAAVGDVAQRGGGLVERERGADVRNDAARGRGARAARPRCGGTRRRRSWRRRGTRSRGSGCP